MTWQQIVVLAFLLFGLINTTYTYAKAKEISAGWVAIAVILQLGISSFYAWVLHSGGFW